MERQVSCPPVRSTFSTVYLAHFKKVPPVFKENLLVSHLHFLFFAVLTSQIPSFPKIKQHLPGQMIFVSILPSDFSLFQINPRQPSLPCLKPIFLFGFLLKNIPSRPYLGRRFSLKMLMRPHMVIPEAELFESMI